MTEAGIGLGANLGDRCSNIAAALCALSMGPAIKLSRVSSVYETSPWGVTDQPNFLNAAALVETDLSPAELLTVCKQIEREIGRVPRQRWGPREIDIDLLFVGEEVMESDVLTLPHPRLFERVFALAPLCEVADGRIVDNRELGASLRHLLQASHDSGVALHRWETERLKRALGIGVS